jgi:uncharacterized protein YbbC (DUF1343 family)
LCKITSKKVILLIMENPLFGIDVLLKSPAAVKNLRLGMVTNDAALTNSGILSRLALKNAGFQLKLLFSPEHGISRKGNDGVSQPNDTDRHTDLPIISLYANKLAPVEADFAEIDAIIFDIPDVGCRFYTYLWTMTHVMEACARYGRPFILCDRPNPIGLNIEKAEGPMLNELACSSFIGRWNIPLKHGCTLGELCIFFVETRLKQLKFDIIRVKNYERANSDLVYGFTPTSPAIANLETAIVYPGMGLLEGINVNEGRGTDTPFRKCGAPWINSHILCKKMQKLDIPGVEFSKTEYTPVSGLYTGEICFGLQWVVANPGVFMAVQTGIKLLQEIIQLHPQHVAERLYITHANPTGQAHLDKLLGIPNAFEKLKNGEMINTDISGEWKQMVGANLLY